MAIDSATFLTQYPEFDGIATEATRSAIIDAEIAFVKTLVEASQWPVEYQERAAFLLAAHNLAVRFKLSLTTLGLKSVDMPGIITQWSEGIDGMDKTVAVNAMVSGDKAFKADMGRTDYGLRYLSMMDMVIAPASLV